MVGECSKIDKQDNELKNLHKMITLITATTPTHYQTAANLFQEYAAQLNVDLSFQNFGQELKTMKTQYALPKGILYLVNDKQENAVGCFGIRAFEGDICELKRMYLKTSFRGKGIGKLLLAKAIEVGKSLGYYKMRLDTLPNMISAITLYQKMGFYEIEPYRFNPIEGTKYFEVELI